MMCKLRPGNVSEPSARVLCEQLANQLGFQTRLRHLPYDGYDDKRHVWQSPLNAGAFLHSFGWKLWLSHERHGVCMAASPLSSESGPHLGARDRVGTIRPSSSGRWMPCHSGWRRLQTWLEMPLRKRLGALPSPHCASPSPVTRVPRPSWRY